jgi:uncharacterized protein (DUF697 family)
MIAIPLEVQDLFIKNLTFAVSDDLTEHENVEAVTKATAQFASAIALEPIPFLDLALMVPLHAKLVLHIGKIYGYNITLARARALMYELGGAVLYGVASRHVVRSVAKLALPGIGALLSPPVAYASTIALGNLAEQYFRVQRDEVPALTRAERAAWAAELLASGQKLASSINSDDLKTLHKSLVGAVRGLLTRRRRSGQVIDV